VAVGTTLQHDRWGFLGQLVLCKPDGSEATVMGEDGEFAWASWSPDGEQIACLTRREIQIFDLESRESVRTLPRNGIYQQLYWSPDGKWFVGTGNREGELWTIARLEASSGELNYVQRNQCCTADWFPGSDRVIFSKRQKDQKANSGYGWTELWMADGDGGNASLLFGEESHVYGGAVSPDGAYVMFGRGPKDDGGGGEDKGGKLCVMRIADAPTILGETPELRSKHPDAKAGPVLMIGIGWEPFWTDRELW
jgi:Tol biopolymer transport system component